jgi:hypothetical protein
VPEGKEIEEYVTCTREAWKRSVDERRRDSNTNSNQNLAEDLFPRQFDIKRKDGVIEQSGIENWLFDVLHVVPQDNLIGRSFDGYPQFKNQRPLRRLELLTGKEREGRNSGDVVRE